DGTANIWDAGPFSPDELVGGTPAQRPLTPFGHQSRWLANQNDPLPETQNSGRPPLPSSLATLLSKLRHEGKSSLADALIREIDQAEDAVTRFQKSYPGRRAHVIVGRVVGDELTNTSFIDATMTVDKHGYFVGPVGVSDRPVGFRALGYYP